MFKEENAASGSATYNTTNPGFVNEGHYFGDELTDKERKAVMEYLKKLCRVET